MSLVEPALATRVLERALARGGELAELYAEARQGFSLSLDDRRVERPQGGRERGACVRVVQGESSYNGYVDGVEEEDLLRVADSVAQALRGEERRPAKLGAAAPAKGYPVLARPEAVDAGRKAELLRACDARARATGAEVSQARVGYTESRRTVEVYNSEGRAASDDRTRVRLGTQTVTDEVTGRAPRTPLQVRTQRERLPTYREVGKGAVDPGFGQDEGHGPSPVGT